MFFNSSLFSHSWNILQTEKKKVHTYIKCTHTHSVWISERNKAVFLKLLVFPVENYKIHNFPTKMIFWKNFTCLFPHLLSAFWISLEKELQMNVSHTHNSPHFVLRHWWLDQSFWLVSTFNTSPGTSHINIRLLFFFNLKNHTWGLVCVIMISKIS